jgi:hypothetical protein
MPFRKIDDDDQAGGSSSGQTRIDPAAITGRAAVSQVDSTCRQLGNEVPRQILDFRHSGTSHNWEVRHAFI